MARCAEKMRVRRGACLHSTSLTRESQLPVSETYVKKSQLDATFASLNMTTAHPLCRHWCFRQRLSCHSSPFHQLCEHVDAETDDSSEKKSFFSNFDPLG